MIELRGRLIILRRPGFSAIRREAGAAVVGVADPIRIFWINPEPVMIAMARRQKIEGFRAIDRFERPGVQHVNRVHRFWICVNLAEIPGALAKTAIVIHLRPFFSAVVRSKDPAFFRFDDGVNAI